MFGSAGERIAARFSPSGIGWYLNQDNGDGFGPLSNMAFGHGGATGTWMCADPLDEIIVVKLGNRLGITLEDGSKMQKRLLQAIVQLT